MATDQGSTGREICAHIVIYSYIRYTIHPNDYQVKRESNRLLQGSHRTCIQRYNMRRQRQLWAISRHSWATQFCW